MKHVKLFESFVDSISDFVLSLMDFETCEIVITGCDPWDSNVGHWHIQEHKIVVKFIGSELENNKFSTRNQLAFNKILKGEFEIILEEDKVSYLDELESVFDRDNILKIANEYDGNDESDLADFASDLRLELYDITLDWFEKQEEEDEEEEDEEEDDDERDEEEDEDAEEEKDDYHRLTPDNTGAILEVMVKPEIVWY